MCLLLARCLGLLFFSSFRPSLFFSFLSVVLTSFFLVLLVCGACRSFERVQGPCRLVALLALAVADVTTLCLELLAFRPFWPVGVETNRSVHMALAAPRTFLGDSQYSQCGCVFLTFFRDPSNTFPLTPHPSKKTLVQQMLACQPIELTLERHSPQPGPLPFPCQVTRTTYEQCQGCKVFDGLQCFTTKFQQQVGVCQLRGADYWCPFGDF